jgi:nitrite reductase/ring-hydroxylating ferredoxin subunit
MTKVYVAPDDEIADGACRIVAHGGQEIGVFKWDGRYYAYRNLCPHQGGPACEGLLMHKVEDVIAPDQTHHGQRFSKTDMHFVCPWHGYEFELGTGECVGNRKLRLKPYRVEAQDHQIYVVLD